LRYFETLKREGLVASARNWTFLMFLYPLEAKQAMVTMRYDV